MPAVLTTASTITCGHSGTVAKTSSAKLKVGENPVLIESSLGDISSCTTTETPPPAGPKNKMCGKVSALTEGKATKLKVGSNPSNPVLLDSLAGTTDGMKANVTPVPGLSAPSAGQTKLKAS